MKRRAKFPPPLRQIRRPALALEQQIAHERIEMRNRLEGRRSLFLSRSARPFTATALVAGRPCCDIVELLGQDEIQEHGLRVGERIEITLRPEAERLDAGDAGGRRPLHHVVADGECARRR